MDKATHTSRAARRPGTAAVKISAGLGLRSSEPPGFRGNAGVCQFHAADYRMNTRVVPPRGFGAAAGFCVFQLWVLEGSAAPALAAPHPDSVAESFLNVGNVIMRRQDTSRARVQVVEPFCGRPDRGTSPQSW